MASSVQNDKAQWAPLRTQIIAMAVSNFPQGTHYKASGTTSCTSQGKQQPLQEVDLSDETLDLLVLYAETDDGSSTLLHGPPQWPQLLNHTIQDVADMPFTPEVQQDLTNFIQHCLFPLLTNIFYEHPDIQQADYWPIAGSRHFNPHDSVQRAPDA